MPLRSLSKMHVTEALEILRDIEEAVENNEPQKVLVDLSAKFYTLVPPKYDHTNPPVIDTYAKVQDEKEIVLTISDIELTLELETHKPVPSIHPVMKKYNMLDCVLELLDKDSLEFKLCQQYSTACPGTRKEHLLDVWRVDRKGERERFAAHNDIKNRKLLWHGTNLAVVAAILKAGLRIMPHLGGLVGEGIYFASEHAKSFWYVRPYHGKFAGEDMVGFMFLVEVALGREKSISEHHSHLIEAPPGYDCVVARGAREPDPEENQIIDLKGNEVVVPIGSPVPIKEWSHSIFEHSEYIIYKESQARIRFMLKFSYE